MPSVEERARGRWALAFVLALLLHAGSGAVVGWVGVPTAHPLDAPVSAPIAFVFESSTAAAGNAAAPSTAAASPPQPTRFTELPPDRADVAPEHADFLSNVDSRARDRRAGGDANALPYMQGRADSPQVGMIPAGAPPAGSPGVPVPDPAPDPADPLAADSGRRPALSAAGPGTNDRARSDLDAASPQPDAGDAALQPGAHERARSRSGDPRPDLLRSGSGMATPSLLQQLGMSDIYQEEMDNPQGNAMQFGAVSLNTTAWNFAPWVQRFLRDVSRNWRAPYAYYLGVIDGYTEVQMEIAPNGRLLRADIVGQKGHESLHQSSLAAVHAAAPYQPLPKDFPEPTLVLRLKMTYLPPPPR